MNITAAFPSKTLRDADIESDMTLTMREVAIETVGQGKDAEEKPVLYFRETDKSLVLNKTNANTIAALYGADTDGWAGKQITLFGTEVDFAGKSTPAIRIRSKKPASGAAPVANKQPVASDMKLVLSARGEAWAAFIDATPAYDEAKRKERWAHAMKTKYPTTPEKSVTAEEWYSFAEAIKESYDQATGDFLPF